MRLSNMDPMVPRFAQIFLGLIALVISIVLCAQDSNYYYASATALFVSCVFTCAGILIFGSLGIFAARQSGSPQWHLQTLLVDILALICSLAAVTCITVAAIESWYGNTGYWIPSMICIYLAGASVLYIVISTFRLWQKAVVATAVQAGTDLEKPASWHVPEQDPRPQQVSITYGNGHVTFKIPESAMEVKDNRSIRPPSEIRSTRPPSEIETAAHWSTASGQATLAQPSIRSSEWDQRSQAAPSYISDIAKQRTSMYAET